MNICDVIVEKNLKRWIWMTDKTYNYNNLHSGIISCKDINLYMPFNLLAVNKF